jgi:hypothetical protein
MGHLAHRAFLARPVRVGELGDDITAFFQGVKTQRHGELAPQRALHADFNVVVVDEYSYILSFLH